MASCGRVSSVSKFSFASKKTFPVFSSKNVISSSRTFRPNSTARCFSQGKHSNFGPMRTSPLFSNSQFLNSFKYVVGEGKGQRRNNPQVKRQSRLRLSLPDTPGEISEQVIMGPFPLRWTPSGLYAWYRYHIGNFWSRRRIAAKLKENFNERFSLPDFMKYAGHLYQGMYTAIANADKSTLEKILTSKFLEVDIVHHQRLTTEETEPLLQKTPGFKRQWFIEGKLLVTKIWVRYMMIPNSPWEVAQICIRCTGNQGVAVYNKNNELVAGSTEAAPFTEYVVFERLIHKKDNTNSQWKICGKLEKNP